jgi:hypothetical protein
VHFPADLRIEDYLRLAVPVAEIDKDNSSEVPAGINPAAERNLFADVAPAEIAAGVSPFLVMHIKINELERSKIGIF